MKRTLLLILLVLCLIVSGCATNNTSENEILFTGYDCTHWGMPKSDVLQILSYVDFYNETETEISFNDARVLNMRDYDLLSLSTFDPFNGGYQIPKVTYHFSEDKLCEITVEYEYNSIEDQSWYEEMVENLEKKYKKDDYSYDENNEFLYMGVTYFDMESYQTELRIETIETKNPISNYGNLSISYKPQTN